jgi:feruloyl esterase
VTDVINSWVHSGTAPETVVATKRDKSLTRLDCAWPRVAHYKGAGDANDPSSWSCVAEGGPAARPGERG